VLLCDEPTASLDPEVADRMRAYLLNMRAQRGLSLVYTSHNMREVEEICDRVLFIHKGKVVALDTPARLLARFNETYLEKVVITLARSGDLFGKVTP
jgi:ABC-2 type transport system ATP-binding protein